MAVLQRLTLAALLLLGVEVAPVLADQGEEELGIEMKSGSSGTPAEAAAKARALAGKYDRAKQHAAEALGLSSVPSTPDASQADAPLPAATPPVQAQASGGDRVYLTNGQTIHNARVVRQDAGGYWIEMEGAEIFFSKSEVKSVEQKG